MKKAEEKETILNYEIGKLMAKKEKKKNKRRNAFSNGSSSENIEVNRLSAGKLAGAALKSSNRKT